MRPIEWRIIYLGGNFLGKSKNGMRKRVAGLRRKVVRNPELPKTIIKDWGNSNIISQIERAIELIGRRR